MERRANEDVIVEVDEQIRESWDKIEVAVNNIGVVSWQVFIWNNCTMIYNLDSQKDVSVLLKLRFGTS